MLETPHAALGAAIAVQVGNPLLALPLSFVSHFALEPLPHWNPHTYTETKTNGHLSKRTIVIIWADALIALGLGLFVAFHQLPSTTKAATVILSCFFAVLPDLIEAPYYFLGKRHAFFDALIKFQRKLQFDVSPLPGLASQAICVLIFLHLALG